MTALAHSIIKDVSQLLSRCLLFVLVGTAISACGLIEIKPAYDPPSPSPNITSAPISTPAAAPAPAPVEFANTPQAATPIASSADNSATSSETAVLVETAALAPSTAVVEEDDLSELPEVIDETSAVQELTDSVEAPLIIPAAQAATPIVLAQSDANSSPAASNSSELPLLNKTATATIAPNILVESQIPGLAVEPADKPETNTTDTASAQSTSAASLAAGISHTVVKDETLYSIASKYGVPVDQIAELNSISPPNYLIYPDMVLKISAATASVAATTTASAEESYSEHEVAEGETIYSISRMYQMQPDELARINDIAIPQYLIYPGMQLKVRSLEPASSAPTPAPATPPAPSPRVAANTANADDNWRWPVASFSQIRDSGTNDLPGILLVANSGDTVRAAKSGRVVVAGEQIRPISLMVLIQHANEHISTYGYMQELTVNEGDEVQAGQVLGRLDGNGRLYFDIRRGSRSVDVLKIIQR